MGNAREYVFLLAVAVALMISSSCSPSGSSNSGQSEGRLVTKAELGDKWPFTVECK